MSAVNAVALLAAAGGDYQISRSVRLRSSASAYFNRTPGSASNRKTWTWSGWRKRGTLGGDQALFEAQNGTTFSRIVIDGNLNFACVGGTSAVVTTFNVASSAVIRDPSAWYHFVVSFDTTQATASNRVRLYINGVQVTSFASSTYPNQNTDWSWNAACAHNIGRYVDSTYGAGGYYDGYATEDILVDGQALTPSSFGETDTITGVWKPKKYAGTYGTNGFYLNFSDNSSNTATTIGKDNSGNGNNWTPNNISVTAGVTYDSMIDVPTLYSDGGNGRGNYAVVNPLSKGTSQTNVIDGNLYAIPTSGGSNWGTVFSSIAVPTSGKWYVEATAQIYAGSGNNSSLGVVDSASFIPTNTAILYQYTTGEGFDGILAHLFSDYVSPIADGVQGTNVTGLTGTSINLMLALDVDNGKVYAGYNGTWLNSGNPAGNTGEVATRTFTSSDVVAGHTSWNGTNDQSQYYNFGQRPFAYTPPTGFKALNTQNLPAPTILKGNKYFDATTYTGTGSTLTVTNGGAMQPDLVWMKARNTTDWHYLIDAVRGGSKILYSNTTSVEATDATAVQSFNSNGFTIGNNAPINTNANTYVGWQWKANGSAVTNTSGSITSQVNANPTAGFSVVTYSTTGASTATIGHGLGAAPKMVIVKIRNGTNTWAIWHSAFGADEWIFFTTTAKGTASGGWNSTLPTSSVFSVGNPASGNTWTTTTGYNYVAYCFSEVAGFSKFGSYTGNGSADGPFIFTGFRPRFVLVKGSTNITEWYVWDSARNQYNVTNLSLNPNQSAAEYSAGSLLLDLTANGFKVRDSVGSWNTSGQTYIFAAFAESPFKNSLAR